MKRFVLAVLLMALPLAAQEEKKGETKPAGPFVQKLFVLKYADPQSLEHLLQVFQARIDANRDLHVLAVSASPETMAAIEDAIKRLDVPSAAATNVDLTVFLVIGHEGESPAGSAPVPKDLDSVVTQLKSAFAFKSYSLMDVIALRTRTGQAANTTSSGGAAPVGPGNATQPVITNLKINDSGVASDGVTIRIHGLGANMKMPYSNGNGFSYMDLGMNTDLDIKEGQKVVIGRLGISKDQALFLVMTAKIVQ
jgi:hypothetical protein